MMDESRGSQKEKELSLQAMPLASKPLEELEWGVCDVWALPGAANRSLYVGLAGSDLAVEGALRVRSQVFNLELGHGSSEDLRLGVDRDRFDAQMSHLLLLEQGTHRIVGTYRMQTVETAQQHQGIYAAQEFDLTPFDPYFSEAVECGRACIVPEYRKATALLALWGGLRAYMQLVHKRWLFGCCSINSQDPDDAWRVMKELRRRDYLHAELCLQPTASCYCGDPSREFDVDVGEPLALPKLFGAYMRLGARVISLPAIDRDFGTIDFLIVIDGRSVNISSLGL